MLPSDGITNGVKTPGPAQNVGPAGVTPPPLQMDAAFGAATWLMMNTPMYRHVFLSDLEWMLLPPILLAQYHFYRTDRRIVAFTSWGYLSEAAEARLQEANPRLAPADWKSGERLWLVSVIAPFGHAEAALTELRATALKGKRFKMQRRLPDGKAIVEEFAGENT